MINNVETFLARWVICTTNVHQEIKCTAIMQKLKQAWHVCFGNFQNVVTECMSEFVVSNIESRRKGLFQIIKLVHMGSSSLFSKDEVDSFESYVAMP
ncbi:hypothetical protein D3C87_1172520 [compost metagenome]